MTSRNRPAAGDNFSRRLDEMLPRVIAKMERGRGKAGAATGPARASTGS